MCEVREKAPIANIFIVNFTYKRNMKTKKMVENKECRVMFDDDLYVYAIKKRGHISFWRKSGVENRQLFEGFFTEIKLLKCEYNIIYRCYLFLKDKHGVCSIVEIINNEIIKTFACYELKKMYRISIDENEEEEKEQDVVIITWNKGKKIYSIWSILRGDIFGPYEYTEIENHNCDVILDGVIAIEDNGYSYDISYLNKVCEGVYYSQKHGGYMFLVDEDGSLFEWMKSDEEDENIYKIETNHNIYTFNSETHEIDCKFLPHRDDDYDYNNDWSKYSDVAYEGYSRLYLGLDD